MNNKTVRMAMLAILTAIVVVLQLLAGTIYLGPFSITLTLLPMVIGSALLGVGAGAWLGFVFGMVVLLSGGATAFLTVNFVGTVITVLVKGAGAGAVAGLVYKLLHKKSPTLAVTVAAFACPVVNTGVFLLGCLLFFMPTITAWAGGSNVFVYMITGLVGLNFVVEMLVNMVLSPVVLRIIHAVQGRKA